MNKIIAWCSIIVLSALVVLLSACRPTLLSDSNTFLSGFVNHELLAVLSVVVSITLASASQMHLTFNRIERDAGRPFLHRARKGVRDACYALIWLLGAAIILVVTKPIAATADWGQSLFNGAALVILLWNVLILTSITQGVFKIGPEAPDA